jgi:hypothetical protein
MSQIGGRKSDNRDVRGTWLAMEAEEGGVNGPCLVRMNLPKTF